MGPRRGERGAADPGGWQRTRRRLRRQRGDPGCSNKGQQAIGRAAGEVSRGPGWLEAAANGARACRHGRVWSCGGLGGCTPGGYGLAPSGHEIARRLQRQRSACTRPGAGRVWVLWGVRMQARGRASSRPGRDERVEEGAGWNAPGGAPVRALHRGSWRL